MQAPRIRLTPAGPEFSRVAFGLWRLGDWRLAPQQRLALLEQALDLGVTTIDHADIYGDYGGEALFGEALALAPQLRARLEIVTKCGIMAQSRNRPPVSVAHYDTSRAHIVAAAENSLRLMGTDYLDLLLIHRPDPLMDPDEMAEAFRALQQAGKVRHFGVSNFTPSQFEMLASRHPLVTNQIELSAMHPDPLYDGTLDQCQRLSVVPMIWSALGGGRLFSEQSPRAERVRAALDTIAAAHDVSAAIIAYAWILRHPARPLVITGSQRIAAMREAVAAAHIVLSREQWFEILRASNGCDVP